MPTREKATLVSARARTQIRLRGHQKRDRRALESARRVRDSDAALRPGVDYGASGKNFSFFSAIARNLAGGA